MPEDKISTATSSRCANLAAITTGIVLIQDLINIQTPPTCLLRSLQKHLNLLQYPDTALTRKKSEMESSSLDLVINTRSIFCASATKAKLSILLTVLHALNKAWLNNASQFLPS